MKQNTYLIIYELGLIDGVYTNKKKFSKKIKLEENGISEESIWNKLELPDNYKSKIILSIQKL